ncbi:polyprenyl synthetase family protein [Bacilliculturomica massiliensis]|uniref:polyprenyl synthetase family protein n=1 Tax=Bacilliculturomica massiliensis TaxID=1917867 RepID=UPI001031B494|nr:farnesyl diphosphate synthase [Bacilliculturomica massiliensis]
MEYREYNRLKAIIDEHILDFLPEVDHKSITLYEAMKYSLTAGGKRLRPVLVLAACDFCGSDMKEALPFACAVEYIHTYSLIHDDLPAMDDDDLRRGVPTNHKVYGEAMALLAGDGLLNSAFEVMQKDMLLYFDDVDKLKCRLKACYEVARCAGIRGMVAGQVADMEAENKQCSKEMLDYIHINKTAALITAAVLAGAHLGCADEQKRQLLASWGEDMGLAFQIVDDILDVCGDEQEIGKKTGVDLKQNKSTYPSIYGLEESKARVFELLDEADELMAPYYDEAEVFNELTADLRDKIK